MEGRIDDEHNEDSALTPPSENTADSPISGDEAAEVAYAPSPKKRCDFVAFHFLPFQLT